MSTTSKITLYYDDTCTLCTTNALEMRAKNPQDIHILSVDQGIMELNEVGISREHAMTYVCVKDKTGKIFEGMHAIRILCKVAKIKYTWILHLPFIKQITHIGYPYLARNRYYVPQWVIRLIYGTVVETSSASHENNCISGICQIPPSKRQPQQVQTSKQHLSE